MLGGLKMDDLLIEENLRLVRQGRLAFRGRRSTAEFVVLQGEAQLATVVTGTESANRFGDFNGRDRLRATEVSGVGGRWTVRPVLAGDAASQAERRSDSLSEKLLRDGSARANERTVELRDPMRSLVAVVPPARDRNIGWLYLTGSESRECELAPAHKARRGRARRWPRRCA